MSTNCISKCVSGCHDCWEDRRKEIINSDIKIGCKVLIYSKDVWAYRVLSIDNLTRKFEINHHDFKLRYHKYLIHDIGCECRSELR